MAKKPPFVRILGLRSNCREDPWVISTEGGAFPYLTDAQLDFLKVALRTLAPQSPLSNGNDTIDGSANDCLPASLIAGRPVLRGVPARPQDFSSG